MFRHTGVDEEWYTVTMEAIKKLNREKRDIVHSKDYKVGHSIESKKKQVKKGGVKEAVKILKKHMKFKKGKKYSMAPFLQSGRRKDNNPDYFCEDKIAVYTCIVGKYDGFQEPLFKPDNVDYYAITDFDIPENSLWKRIDVSDYDDILKDMTPVLKNRYFKMHPEKVFKDYKYSIYIDGNIRVCSDMTEYVNYMKRSIATFKHAQRECVYQECMANLKMSKVPAEDVKEQIRYLKKQNLPENYGLANCNVIVREHNNPECISCMDMWWEEFKAHVKRDQLSFPLVLMKNDIPMKDVTVLGTNVYREDSFEVVDHIV